MKTNGTIKVAPAPGKSDINPVEPALIVGAFAIVQRKGTRKNHYDVFHVNTRVGVFYGLENEHVCKAGIKAITGLCDWDSNGTIEDFNTLPTDTRNSIGKTWYEACETWRAGEKRRKLERKQQLPGR